MRLAIVFLKLCIPVFVCLFVCLMYFWLRWLFVVARGLSLVAASGGYSPLRCAGLLVAVVSLVAENELSALGLQ